MIQIWINDPRSLGSWRSKGTDEFALGKDLPVPLMRHDPSDLGSLIQIWIIPNERTLSVLFCISKGMKPLLYSERETQSESGAGWTRVGHHVSYLRNFVNKNVLLSRDQVYFTLTFQLVSI